MKPDRRCCHHHAAHSATLFFDTVSLSLSHTHTLSLYTVSSSLNPSCQEPSPGPPSRELPTSAGHESGSGRTTGTNGAHTPNGTWSLAVAATACIVSARQGVSRAGGMGMGMGPRDKLGPTRWATRDERAGGGREEGGRTLSSQSPPESTHAVPSVWQPMTAALATCCLFLLFLASSRCPHIDDHILPTSRAPVIHRGLSLSM